MELWIKKNTSLEELAKTMPNESNLPKCFCADVVRISCVLNKIIIRSILKLTPYELFYGRKSNISHLKVLGCKHFVLNNQKENLRNFD